MSRQGTYRALAHVRGAVRARGEGEASPVGELKIPDHPIRSESTYLCTQVRRVDRLIGAGGREGGRECFNRGVFYPLLYYMPIALRFSSEYPTGLPRVLAVIMGRRRRTLRGRAVEREETRGEKRAGWRIGESYSPLIGIVGYAVGG